MGRGARIALTVVVAGLFGLICVGSGVVALASRIDLSFDEDCVVYDPGGMDCIDDQLTERSTATVIDVDISGYEDPDVDLGDDADEYCDDDDYCDLYVSVDVDFSTSSEHVVTTIDLGDPDERPQAGDTVVVAYRDRDPEDTTTLLSVLNEAHDGTVPLKRGSHLNRTAGQICGAAFALAVVSLIVGIIGVRRAPRPEAPPAASGYGAGYGSGWGYGYGPHSGYPAPGWGYPPQAYPQSGWGQPPPSAQPPAGWGQPPPSAQPPAERAPDPGTHWSGPA
jgi:hypothetical protein